MVSLGSIWNSVVDTAESIGGAAIAPLGAVWDVASTPFDDKDDNFGSVLAKVAKRGGDMLDPLTNNETVTGMGFNKGMAALDWTYDEVVSQPLATVGTMFGHMKYQNQSGLGFNNFGDLFSGEMWGEAYDLAENRSIGQAFTLADKADDHEGDAVNPMDARAWEKLKEQGNASDFQLSFQSGAIDFASRWYLDPAIVVGKGAGALRKAKTVRNITDADHAKGIAKQLDDAHYAEYGARPFRFKPQNLATRTEKYLGWLETGADGGRMNATQIWFGTPELRRSGSGKQVASLLEQAGKIGDDAVRRDTQRHILAVAYGDAEAAFKAKSDLADFTRINDELKNIAKGNVLELKTSAFYPQIAANPELVAHAQGQLDSIPQVQRAVDNHVKRLEALIGAGDNNAGVMSSLDQAVGASAKGRRAVGRQSGHGLLKDGKSNLGHKAADAPLSFVAEQAQRIASHPGFHTVFQASPTSMPLRIVTTPLQTGAKVAGKFALGYARTPGRAMDALRTTHLTGMVNLHDWNGATTQLDSMLQGARVAPGTRMDLLSRAHLARTEGDKMRIIEEVEREAVTGLAAHYSAKSGMKIDRDFITAVMTRGGEKRAMHLAPRQGRIYAATKQQVDPLRQSNVDRLEDVAMRSGEDTRWRVDQVPATKTIEKNALGETMGSKVVGFDDDMVPVAMPLLETQLANMVPLVDTLLIDKMLKRETGALTRHAQAWADLRVAEDSLKAATGSAAVKQLQSIRAAQDWLVTAASHTLRAWKFGVLFRLGYPLRVVADDHLRIWSQIGAMSVMGPMREEFASNFKYNQFTRRAQVSKNRAALRAERTHLSDMLDNETELAAFAERQAEIRKLNRQIASGKWAAERTGDAGRASRVDELTAQRDALMEAQGLNPESARRRITEIDSLLARSKKQQRKEIRKKRIGEKDRIIIGQDGTVYNYRGAFGGENGDAYRGMAGSSETWDNNMRVSEETTYQSLVNDGNWQTVVPGEDEARHLTAWSDVLNNQFRQSQVAMHFIKGGTVDEFVKWIKQPAQKQLRDRLPHFSRDPEDWGNRVQQVVDSYLGSQKVRDAIASGRVTPEALRKMWPDQMSRPAVHGATVANNLGTSAHQLNIGKSMNRIMGWLAVAPTDKLSRHPYFAAIYNTEVRKIHARMIDGAEKMGKKFGPDDMRKIEAAARRNALADLKRTLFDMEAHSNAANFMRFVSPFFAAHQESITRWWRILSENPAIARRAVQMFDIPKKLHLVVDEEGEPVPDGTMPGPNQYLLLQLPEDWGGGPIDPEDPDFKGFSEWSIGLNSFNFVLQNGNPLNPGVGPMVQVPMDKIVAKYTEYEDIERVVKMLNPYPANSTLESVAPAWARRIYTAVRGEKSGEFVRMWNNNFQDKLIEFRKANGYREPSKAERSAILRAAKDETQVEAVLRIGQNWFSPFPANPRSRFEVVRQGYSRLWDQARTEGRDFDWVMEQFKAKYGDVYLPLMQSTSNNTADMPLTNEAVGAVKRHRNLLDRIDPRLHGAIVAPEAGDEADYSAYAARYFRDNPMEPGRGDTYLSYDDPAAAFEEGAVKRGWSMYGDAMDSLQALAVDNGLKSWRDSDYLMKVRDDLVDQIAESNPYWGSDWRERGEMDFEGLVADLRAVAEDRSLSGDVARQDVQALRQYLQLRDTFAQALEMRAAAGGATTMEAQANSDLASLYWNYFSQLEESNTFFQRYFVNGLIDRDPFLVPPEERVE